MYSKLVDCIILSPNHSGKRTHKIERITPHCIVGQLKAENIGGCFTSPSRKASCNYGIGTEGRVCLVVDEDNRSWCTSSNFNDQRAITIECASDKTAPYKFNDIVYNKLIDLTVDIMQRYNKNRLVYIADKATALKYEPKSNEMLLTFHRWYANKSCPGQWLVDRADDYVNKVNKHLSTDNKEEKQEVENKQKVETVIKVGDSVKFTGNAKQWDNKAIPEKYKTREYKVKSIGSNGRTVLTYNNTVMYAVDIKYLTLSINSQNSVIDCKDYLVRVNTDELNIRKGPGTQYNIVGKITDRGVYTIIETNKEKTWGRLKSKIGWIHLGYTKVI